jgi:hypothetical protein
MPLLFHHDSLAIQRQQLAKVKFPPSAKKRSSLPHFVFLEMVEQGLDSAGLEIVDQVHELGSDGKRYFGILEIRKEDAKRTSSWVVGVRNWYDRAFPSEIVAGARVLVSDSLSFSGRVNLDRDHSGIFHTDLAEQMPGIIRMMGKYWLRHEHRIDAYRNYALNDMAAHDLVIRAVDVGICHNGLIPDVLANWRVPNHEDFRPRTSWSLFNAFTEAFQVSLFDLPDRTEKLHRLFDARVGIKTYPRGMDGG